MSDGTFPPAGDPGRPGEGPATGPLAWGPPPPGPNQVPPGPPPAGQASPGQAHPGQPYAGQPYAGQVYPGQPYAGQVYPGQPYAGQPYPAQPYPAQAYAYGGALGIGVPPRPSSLSTAVLLMRIGGLIAALSVLATLGMRSEIEAAVRESQPYATESDLDAAVTLGIGFALVFGLIGSGLWFWMAAANARGRSWARIVASVFFGLSVLSVLSTQVGSGPALSKLVNLVQFGIGLAAIILMYRPESSRYYAARSGRR